jgi:hypothetical protein
MKHLLYILIGISCLGACTSSPDSHFPRYSDFTKTKALSAQVINLDTILFRYPFRVTIRDSIAVVMDLHNIDHYLPIRSGNILLHSADVEKPRRRCYQQQTFNLTP